MLITLALAVWLASIAYRNRDRLQVRHVAWENNGPYCTVKCEIWNPRDQPVTAMARMRLVSYGGEESALGPSVGAEHEFAYRIDAHSHVKIQEVLRRIPSGEPEVRAYAIPHVGDR